MYSLISCFLLRSIAQIFFALRKGRVPASGKSCSVFIPDFPYSCVQSVPHPLYFYSSISDRPFRYLIQVPHLSTRHVSLTSRLTSGVYHGVVFFDELLFTVFFPKASAALFFMFCLTLFHHLRLGYYCLGVFGTIFRRELSLLCPLLIQCLIFLYTSIGFFLSYTLSIFARTRQ